MPLADPNRPGSQGPLQVAVTIAAVAPYRPALQLVHTPAPARLYLPAGQTDAVGLLDPATQAHPAAHNPLQAAEVSPDTLPYRPAGQGVQDPAPSRE
jgi:hypothetical protein